MSSKTDTLENVMITNVLTVIEGEFGDGDLEVDGTVYTDNIFENTTNNSVNLESIKFKDKTYTIPDKDITTLSNPSSGEHIFCLDSTSSQLKSKNSSGIITTYQPITTKGDLVSHDGTTQIRIGVGTNEQVLTADSTTSSGIKWANLPVFGTFYSNAVSTGSSSTTSTSFVNRLTLTTSSIPAGNYIYTITSVHSFTTLLLGSHECRAVVDGTQDNIITFDGNTTVTWPVTFRNIVTLSSGTHTISLQYRCIVGGTATSRNVCIDFYRVS